MTDYYDVISKTELESERSMKYPWLSETVTKNGQDYKITAKVFNRPSASGIDGSRISKMEITDLETVQIIYNYSRGLDFDIAPPGLVDWAVLFMEYESMLLRFVSRFKYVLAMIAIANLFGMIMAIGLWVPIVYLRLFMVLLTLVNVGFYSILSSKFTEWVDE